MKKRLTTLVNCLLLALICSGVVQANDSLPLEQVAENSKKIEADYSQIIHFDQLPKQTKLAQEVIKQRTNYSVDVVAQAFYLLAQQAADNADQAKATQLLLNALELPILSTELQANIQLNLAVSYYAKAKYSLMLATLDQVLDLLSKQSETYYYALAYRAIAHVALGNISNAITDTQQVMSFVIEHENQIHFISLFEVTATANFRLQNLELAKGLYLKKIDKTIKHQSIKNLDRSYYNLAQVYKQLNALDDAQNAYWQAMQYAEQKQAVIAQAYINMGLAEVMLLAQNYQAAYDGLQKTEAIFKVNNLPRAYLTNIMLLAKAANALDKRLVAFQLLNNAEQFMQRIELTSEQYELYQMLANKYGFLGQYQQAFQWQQKYTEQIEQQQSAQHKISHVKQLSQMEQNQNQLLNDKLNRQLSENLLLIEQQKQLSQNRALWILSCVFLVLSLILCLFKLRNIRRENEYFTEDKPASYLPSHLETKQKYQLAYKQARQFQYPLTIVYIRMMNWHDLKYHFRRKIIQDVAANIATIINEHLMDYDFAGQLSEGEYLLLFPHRQVTEINTQLNVLVDALKMRFFANLGSFSVILETAVASPSAQDIDPITFLSTLSAEVEHRATLIEG